MADGGWRERFNEWSTKDRWRPTPRTAADDRAEAEALDAASRARERWPELDGSVEGTTRVDEIIAAGCDPADVYLLSAYVGEVLRANVAEVEWRQRHRHRHGGPVLGYERWVLDPHEYLERIARHIADPRTTVHWYVASTIELLLDPTPVTMARIGLHRGPRRTAWRDLRDDWGRWRRRRARRDAARR